MLLILAANEYGADWSIMKTGPSWFIMKTGPRTGLYFLVGILLLVLLWFAPKRFTANGVITEVYTHNDTHSVQSIFDSEGAQSADSALLDAVADWLTFNSEWHMWSPSPNAFIGGTCIRTSAGDHIRLQRGRVIFNVNGSYQFTRSVKPTDEEFVKFLKGFISI